VRRGEQPAAVPAQANPYIREAQLDGIDGKESETNMLRIFRSQEPSTFLTPLLVGGARVCGVSARIATPKGG
jgi:hypothetical protein